MLKLLMKKTKQIKKHCLKHNMRFILIVLVIIGGLLSLSFYSIAKSSTHHSLSIDIKNALLTASTIPLLSENNITADNTLHSTHLTRNEPLPDALPATLSNKSLPVRITATTISDFPSQLPDSFENVENQTENQLENINTPEYVIIRSSDRVTFSSEMTAKVALIAVKEGSYFKINDILLEFDCRERVAELKKAEAQQRSMNEANKSALKLQSYGSISEYELIKAQSEASMANADVDKLKAIVDKCTIKAPFNGAVSELMVHAHETVKPGDPLLKIVNTDNLELQMQVPSSWLQWIKIGTNFNVHISELGKPIAAKITKINPQIDSVSQTVKIVGIIIERDPELRPGMSGQAIFPDNPDTKNVKSKH
jgi:membrane fusion protein (multidrug efflux system)